MQLETASFLSV